MELIDTYLIDAFDQDQEPVIDRYTFVFDERNPQTGYYTMLAMSEDGWRFSQWTEGLYDPNGDNAHLGRRVDFHTLGEVVLGHLMDRLSINWPVKDE